MLVIEIKKPINVIFRVIFTQFPEFCSKSLSLNVDEFSTYVSCIVQISLRCGAILRILLNDLFLIYSLCLRTSRRLRIAEVLPILFQWGPNSNSFYDHQKLPQGTRVRILGGNFDGRTGVTAVYLYNAVADSTFFKIQDRFGVEVKAVQGNYVVVLLDGFEGEIPIEFFTVEEIRRAQKKKCILAPGVKGAGIGHIITTYSTL